MLLSIFLLLILSTTVPSCKGFVFLYRRDMFLFPLEIKTKGVYESFTYPYQTVEPGRDHGRAGGGRKVCQILGDLTMFTAPSKRYQRKDQHGFSSTQRFDRHNVFYDICSYAE